MRNPRFAHKLGIPSLRCIILTVRKFQVEVEHKTNCMLNPFQRLIHMCIKSIKCYLCIARSILLGTRGFDVPKLSQRLETLNTAKSLEPLEPVWETDIEVNETTGLFDSIYCASICLYQLLLK